MNDHFERVGSSDAWAPSAKTFAITLKRVATLSQKLSEGEMKEIVTMIETIKPSNGGLSLRSRDKVAQFHDPNIMQQLVELPNRLFMESDTLFKSGLLDRAARLHARALQLAILLTNPLRRKTLSALDIDRHFTRDKNGRFTRILIPSSDVKNGRVIEAIMPDELVERLHRHIQLHRQTFLNGTASSFLFPGKLSGHVSPDTVSRAIKSLVETEIGVDFNVHLVRHIVATLLLEDDPRNMPVAQQMLGHWQCKSIERQYGHARGYAAQKAWNSKLANYRDKEAGKRIGRN
jgi:integrase